MKEFIKKNIFILLGIVFVLTFFYKFFLQGLLPIPTDNIVGLYHPYRDFYSNDYPRGIPFQNNLVTDPVRQQYVWKELAVDQMKQGELPLWNSYSFTGYPLLANFQSAVFYPLNLLMFVFPFVYGWTLLIISQVVLAFIFMYLYLKNLELSRTASFIGGAAFSFSGYFVAWLEWGNIVSTGLWLPLILLSIDKITSAFKDKSVKDVNIKNAWIWILLLSFIFSFFAGHIQTFFYLSLISLGYVLLRLIKKKNKLKAILLFALLSIPFFVITAIQWLPTLQLINLSARGVDQVATDIPGWFVPWQNLTQFIAPDFFGNPATLNYWGVWNYGEFIGYVGLLPLILALGALFFCRNKTVIFYGAVLIIGIIFAYPSFISKFPFALEIPFISTAQPTRLMYIITSSLAVLAAFGFDYFIKNKKKIVVPLFIIGGFIVILWSYVFFNNLLPVSLTTEAENLAVTKSNLRLPTLIFGLTFVLFIAYAFAPKIVNKKGYSKLIIGLLILLFLMDIFRFADKYTVFSKKEYLYPTTETIEYFKDREGEFRIMETDSRLFPPNFNINYRIQSVDGYDPLYLMRYAELASAVGRGDPNINPPFGFNRIITPQNFREEVLNILDVDYLLSLSEIDNARYERVMKEGETFVYKNNDNIKRAFFAERTYGAEDRYDAIEKIFEHKDNLSSTAIVEDENYENFDRSWSNGNAEIINYEENRIEIEVNNDEEGFLVLLDTYYPTWRATIDGSPAEIIRTNYNFRGVIVPAGSKKIVFTNHIF